MMTSDPFALGETSMAADADLIELIAEFKRREALCYGLGHDDREIERRADAARETRDKIEEYHPRTLWGVLTALTFGIDHGMSDPDYRPTGAIRGLFQILSDGAAASQASAQPPALAPSQPSIAYTALYIDHANMAPDVPRGSIAFVEPPAFHGEGVYSIPFRGEHRGDLRRACYTGAGWALRIDNWPDHEQPSEVYSLAVMRGMGLRRVAGVARSFSGEFAEFLRSVAPGSAE